MIVSINFEFATDIYPFVVDWKLPYFPSIGHSLELEDILSDTQLEEAKNIKFVGKGKYQGINTSLFSVLRDCYDNKITQINWRKEGAEIFILNQNYSQKPERWV